MANEIVASISLSALKSGVDIKRAFSGQFDMSGSRYIHNTQTVGTSEEALVMGDVGTPGWAIFKNHDTTNFVEIRPGTGDDDLVKLKAGEFCTFRFSADATAPYALADTASVALEYLIFSN